MALQDHAERVAHEQDFDAGFACDAGETGIVCGETGKLFTAFLNLMERGQSYVSNLALAAHGVVGSALSSEC